MSHHQSTKVELTCEVCKKSFLVRRSYQNTARFCSWTCRKSTRIKCVCEICGKSFSVKPSAIKRGTPKFCSLDCIKSNKAECTCEVCGKQFFTKPSYLKRGPVRFCSMICRRSTRIERCCETCGSLFRVAPNRIKNENPSFCSSKCYHKNHRRIPLIDRFRSYIGETTESGCMIWNGVIDKQTGYGRAYIESQKSDGAHRVAWMFANGSIPEGLWVLHRCDNKICVNPDHLFLGTNQDNIADKVSKGRQSKGETHGHAKLSAEEVRSIRERFALGGISQADLAREFGVRSGTISRIITRIRRKDG